jgi:hypothetical protein
MDNDYRVGQLVRIIAGDRWSRNWKLHDKRICRVYNVDDTYVYVVSLDENRPFPSGEKATLSYESVEPL